MRLPHLTLIPREHLGGRRAHVSVLILGVGREWHLARRAQPSRQMRARRRNGEEQGESSTAKRVSQSGQPASPPASQRASEPERTSYVSRT